jgi:hypothetical protein
MRGLTDCEIAEQTRMSVQGLEQLRERLVEEGFEVTLKGKHCQQLKDSPVPASSPSDGIHATSSIPHSTTLQHWFETFLAGFPNVSFATPC